MNARVNNLTSYHVGEVTRRSRDFIVRPVAVRDTPEGPELVCWFVHTTEKNAYSQEKFTLIAGTPEPGPGVKSEGREPSGDDTPVFPGPDNTMLTTDEWLVETSDGCSMCGSSLSLASAHSVQWFDGEPVCEPCVEHYKDLVMDAEEAEGQAAGDAA
jgi:hypothetical protein